MSGIARSGRGGTERFGVTRIEMVRRVWQGGERLAKAWLGGQGKGSQWQEMEWGASYGKRKARTVLAGEERIAPYRKGKERKGGWGLVWHERERLAPDRKRRWGADRHGWDRSEVDWRVRIGAARRGNERREVD